MSETARAQMQSTQAAAVPCQRTEPGQVGNDEKGVALRQRICEDIAWLGVAIERQANPAGEPRTSSAPSAVSVWELPTNEQ